MGTHSAFLLRQFDYESRNNADVAQIGYTALRRTGTSIDIAQGASLDDFDEEHLQTLKDNARFFAHFRIPGLT